MYEKKCAYFIQGGDKFSAGVKAFDFIGMVFSLQNASEHVVDTPQRLNTAQVSLVWGIESVDHAALGGDPFSISMGDPVYMKDFDITHEESQRWILHVCDVSIKQLQQLLSIPDITWASFSTWFQSCWCEESILTWCA